MVRLVSCGDRTRIARPAYHTRAATSRRANPALFMFRLCLPLTVPHDYPSRHVPCALPLGVDSSAVVVCASADPVADGVLREAAGVLRRVVDRSALAGAYSWHPRGLFARAARCCCCARISSGCSWSTVACVACPGCLRFSQGTRMAYLDVPLVVSAVLDLVVDQALAAPCSRTPRRFCAPSLPPRLTLPCFPDATTTARPRRCRCSRLTSALARSSTAT